MTIRIKTYSPT